MRAPVYQLDAFTRRRFSGNPAAVMIFENFPADQTMQEIAAENNLAETAFIVPEGNDYHIRWFTPAVEVPLCGHATLASAAVIMERLEHDCERVVFHSISGPLIVTRVKDRYVMNFPARRTESVVAVIAEQVARVLGFAPVEVVTDSFNYIALLEEAQQVREHQPNFSAIASLDRSGLVITAAGDSGYDCVSRYFAPAKGIPEDPVTGGAHCSLAPYWAKRLNKTQLRAYQASRRGGEIVCRVVGDRVELQGTCVFYMEGFVTV